MVKKESGKKFVLGFVKKSLNFPWLYGPRPYNVGIQMNLKELNKYLWWFQI